MYVCIYIYIYTCIHVYMYIYIYTYYYYYYYYYYHQTVITNGCIYNVTFAQSCFEKSCGAAAETQREASQTQSSSIVRPLYNVE